jgi:hypothetical protein
MMSTSSSVWKATSSRGTDRVFEEVFWSVILPALCAGIVAACCLIPSGLSHKTMWRRGVIALTLMGAAAGSFIGSVGMPAWPPAQKWHGIF